MIISGSAHTSACDILAVDDTPQNLTAVEVALESAEYRIVSVQSGQEALRLVLEREFALILLDVQMPGMNGFDVATLVRGRERSRHIPIIFMTAHSDDDEQVSNAYSLGAVDFIFKPIQPDVLRAKVAVFATLHRRTLEARSQAEQIRAHVVQERQLWITQQNARLEAEVLEQQIEDQRARAAELEELNQRLADNERRKDEFLALLGHELRNPLAPLVSGLALLEGAGVGGPVPAMQRQVTHLIRLVEDLLDMSLVMRGRITIRRSPVRAGDILDQAVALAMPLIVKHRHTLTVIRASTESLLYADAVRMTQALTNLLNNSARYTPDGGQIEARCDAGAAEVRFTVKDNGRGMSAELLPRVFEFFVQAREGGGGLGIGLGLVKQLVEMHDGRVEARSAGLGLGSEVSIWVSTCPDELVGTGPAAPVWNTGTARRSLSIVLVEDNDDVRLLLEELLVSWGHVVQAAASAASGLELIVRSPPDVAFIDIGLPDMNGCDLARRICNTLGLRRPTLIALSGFSREHDRALALEAGFDHHLSKPASPGDLEQVLAEEHQRVAQARKTQTAS